MLFLLNLIAIEAGLTAFGDLFTLIGVTSGASGVTANDAQSMAAISGIPALIWAVLWALLAAAVIGFALWRTWVRRKPV